MNWKLAILLTLLGQDPMKCKHWETVFAAECPGETAIKNKEKQNKGILNLSTHKETVRPLDLVRSLESLPFV